MNIDSSKVRTGDILLFSNNTSTGFMLRTSTGSLWNHAGIAVRLLPECMGALDISNRISLDDNGELYILEINTGQRRDGLTGEHVKGAALSPWIYAANMYNLIAVRQLRNEHRTHEIRKRTIDFANKHRGTVFAKGIMPFIGVWWGIPLAGTKPRGTADAPEMFCTELIVHYYLEVILGVTDAQKSDSEFCTHSRRIFGSQAPTAGSLWTPEHFTGKWTPGSTYIHDSETVIYHQGADLLTAILQPLLLVLFIMTIAAIFFYF